MVQSPRSHVIFQDVHQIDRCLVSRLYSGRDAQRETIIPRKGLVSPSTPSFPILFGTTLMLVIISSSSFWMSWVHRPLTNSTLLPRDDQRNISVRFLLGRRFRLGNYIPKHRRKLLISWIILWPVRLLSSSLFISLLHISSSALRCHTMISSPSPSSCPLRQFRRTLTPWPFTPLLPESELIASRPTKEIHSRRMPSPPLPPIIPWSRRRTSC